MTQPQPLLGTPRKWADDLAIATAVGAFLGIIGPFGSFNNAALPERLAYWVCMSWIGVIICGLTLRLFLRLGGWFSLPVWFSLTSATVIGAAPFTATLVILAPRFWGDRHGRVESLLDLYGQVLLVSLAYTFAYHLVRRRSRPAPAPSVQVPPPAPLPQSGPSARFTDRLPARLGRDLLCLQMEDHYLRAHTALGSELILLPLRAAMAELDDIEGAQVHRSWWVARAAVARCATLGRNHTLILTNGLQVPVSRTSVARLRAMGWLEVRVPA